jgi:hypothetical protein
MEGPITVSDVEIDGEGIQAITGVLVSGNVIQQQTNFVRGRPAQFLSAEEVDARTSCYVPVRDDELIRKELMSQRAVGLVGPDGIGRETAGIAAMRGISPRIEVRRFSLEDEDAEEILRPKAPRGYLVRVTASNLERLGRCVENVRANDGYLVAITDLPERILTDFTWIPVEPPTAILVYREWVKHLRIPQWTEWPRAISLLAGDLPCAGWRLADLGARAARRGGDIAQLQDEVEHAYLDWTDELRDWFALHPNPLERMLLIAAVTLPSDADEGYVYEAAARLASRLHPEIAGAGLVWCPVTGLRKLLGADAIPGLIAFRRYRYAESALRHAFDDFPLARDDLFSWLAELPTESAASYGISIPVAQTFADLAADHGAAERISDASLEWGRNDKSDLAFTALSRTCLHPRVGVRIREALYEWSRNINTPVSLKLVIARTCQVLGASLPSVALTRLKHLATQGGSQVAMEVVESALEVADLGNDTVVRAACLDWCAQTSKDKLSTEERRRRRKTGAMLFLRLASDQVLPTDSLPGWYALLDFCRHRDIDGAALQSTVRLWLDTALRQEHLRDQIVSVFVAAATPRLVIGPHGDWKPTPDRSAAESVICLTEAWAGSDPARQRIKDGIVIPLTYPWWRRCLRTLAAWLRRR